MHRHGVGRFQFIQLGKVVLRHFVIKQDGQGFRAGIDALKNAYVAVENPRANHASIRFLPKNVVIVVNLHHPVALPEQVVAEGPLLFLRGRRVQRRLKQPVQVHRAHRPLTGGGKHLNLVGGNSQFLGQPHSAQIPNQTAHRLFVISAHEEKVTGDAF